MERQTPIPDILLPVEKPSPDDARSGGGGHGGGEFLDATLKVMEFVATQMRFGDDVARRLLQDQSIWLDLLRSKVHAEETVGLNEDLRVSHWALEEGDDAPLPQRACVETFAQAVRVFGMPESHRPVFLQREWDEHVARFLQAAQTNREFVRELLPLLSLEEREMVEGAANCMERLINQQQQHTADAYIVGERTNRPKQAHNDEPRGFDDLTRGRTRDLAEFVRKIYDAPLNTVIARIATVASNSAKDITDRDVINWTRSD
jgi:hypothetical protein